MKKIPRKTARNLTTKLALGAIFSAPILMVACSDDFSSNMGSVWSFDSHRKIQKIATTPDGQNPFYGRDSFFIAKNSYVTGSHANDFTNATLIGFLRKEKIGFDQIKIADVSGTIDKNVNRQTTLKFELSSYVKLVDNQGSTYLFDSDSDDPNDKRSINGLEFKKVLNLGTISKIIFNLSRKSSEKHWIKQFSGEKGEKFAIEDFYSSVRHKIFLNNSRLRLANGGTTEIDEFINLIDNSQTFNPISSSSSSDTYSEAQTLYGLKLSNFINDDEKSEVLNLTNNEFVFNFDTTLQSGLLLFWNKMFFTIEGSPFAMPTFLINYAQKKSDQLIRDKLGQTKFEEFKKSEVYRSGVYHLYTLNKNEYYVGGKYFFNVSTNKLLGVKQNLDYVDERWLNSVNSKGQLTTVDTAIYKFIQSGVQSDLQTISEFKAGTTVLAGFDSMSDEDKISALKFLGDKNLKNDYGVIFKTAFTSGQIILGDYDSWQMLPLLPSKVNGNVFYNNNFAKVMWNRTISELKSGQDANGDWAKAAFSGTGLAFRTNLVAAINAYTFLKQAAPTSVIQEITTRFAPEANVPGKDALPNSPKTTFDFSKLLARNIATVDYNSNAIEFDAIAREDYIKSYTSPDTASVLGPFDQSILTKIKSNISAALDAAQIGQNEKVIWEGPTGRGPYSPNRGNALKLFAEYINSLDPRLMMVAKVNPGKEDGSIEATVQTQNYDTDFTFVNSTGTHDFVYRIYAAGSGYNIASINTQSAYSINSPAYPMFADLDNFQDGMLFAYSLYSNSATSNNLPSSFKSNIDNIISSLNESLVKVKNRFGASTFKSMNAATFLSAINNFKLEDVWKTNPINVADHQTLGLKGFEQLIPLAKSIEGKEVTNMTLEERNLYDDLGQVSNFVLIWKTIATSDLALKMNSDLTINQVVDTMDAFNKLAPGSLTPMSISIGDRSRLNISLQKTWFYDGVDELTLTNLSWARVDLD